jgi:hypothetical protein
MTATRLEDTQEESKASSRMTPIWDAALVHIIYQLPTQSKYTHSVAMSQIRMHILHVQTTTK